MEIALSALGNGDIGLNATSLPYPFRKNIPEETLTWEKLFGCGKHSRYCRRRIG
jgi:hypothetical protein